MTASPYKVPEIHSGASASSKRLRRFSVAALIFNAVSLLLLNTREWLVHFDPSVFAFVACPVFVFLVPAATFFAVSQKREDEDSVNKFACLVLIASEAFWFLMIAIGTFCRDAFMTFRWPWKSPGMLVVAVNDQNLSDIFWQRILACSAPANPVIRELPGELMVVVYFMATTIVCWCVLRPLGDRLWWWLIVVSQMALFFPCAVLVKRIFGIKYLITYPEIFLNL